MPTSMPRQDSSLATLRPVSRGVVFSARPGSRRDARPGRSSSSTVHMEQLYPANEGAPCRINGLDARVTSPVASKESLTPSVALSPKPALSASEVADFVRRGVAERTEQLVRAFRALDPGRAGTVSHGELRRVLDLFVLPLTDPQFGALLVMVPAGRNGNIPYLQFLEHFLGQPTRPSTASSRQKSTPPAGRGINEETDLLLRKKLGRDLKGVVRTFRLFDYNGDGRVQRHELRAVLESHGARLSESQFSKLWARHDVHKGGTVAYQEFLESLGLSQESQWHPEPDTVQLLLNWEAVRRDAAEERKQLESRCDERGYMGQAGDAKETEPEASPEELQAAFRKKVCENYSNLQRAFRAFDSSGAGTLAVEDFVSVLRSFTLPLAPEAMLCVLDQLGIKATGKVPWELFLAKFPNPQSIGNGQTLPMRSSHRVNPFRGADESTSASEVLARLRKHILECYPSLKEAFLALDINRQGRVTRQELRRLVEGFGFRMGDSHFRELMLLLDPGHSGFVDYTDFLCLFEPRETLDAHKWLNSTHRVNGHKTTDILTWKAAEEILRDKLTERWKDVCEAFDSCDQDADGFITQDNLRAILRRFGPSLSDEHFNKLCKGCEQGPGFRIRFSEFLMRLGVDPRPGDFAGVSSRLHSESNAREVKRQADLSARLELIEGEARKLTGALPLREVLVRLRDHVAQRDTTLHQSFARHDRRGEGRVSNFDFRQILQECGMIMEDDQFNALLQRLGFTNGSITYSDFLACFEDRRIYGPGEQLLLSPNHRVAEVSRQHCRAEDCHAALPDKLRQVYTDLRSAFNKADSDRDGAVTAGDLRRLLETLHFSLTDGEFGRLLGMLGLNERSRLSYGDFLQKFDPPTQDGGTRWLDAGARIMEIKDPSEMACEQAHQYLVSRARKSWKDVSQAFRDYDENGDRVVQKSELRTLLFRYMLPLTSHDFDSLWARYDPDGHGVISEQELARLLDVVRPPTGVDKGPSARIAEQNQATLATLAEGQRERRCELVGQQARRGAFYNLEQLAQEIKDKFRDKYSDFGAAFARADRNKDGFVTADDLRHMLCEHNYSLDHEQFEQLLGKLGIPTEGSRLSYADFVRAVDDGRASRYGARPSQPCGVNATQRLSPEGALAFLREKVPSLLAVLQKAFGAFDKSQRGLVKEEEFRRVLDNFCLKLDEPQFQHLLKRLKRGGDGTVDWQDFLEAFSLLSDKTESADWQCEVARAALAGHRGAGDCALSAGGVLRRLRDVVSARFYAVARALVCADLPGIGKLTREQFRQVVHRHFLRLSDKQFEELWAQLPVDECDKLDYREFLKRFCDGTALPAAAFTSSAPTGMLRQSVGAIGQNGCTAPAAAPAAAAGVAHNGATATKSRPKTTASCLLTRSQSLNTGHRPATVAGSVRGGMARAVRSTPLVDCEALESRLRERVSRRWQEILRECRLKDPTASGEIGTNDLQGVLRTFDVSVSEDELAELASKFAAHSTGHVAYRTFLRHLVLTLRPRQHGLLQRQRLQQPSFTPGGTAPNDAFLEAMLHLRDQVLPNWRPMRRAFRAGDPSASGFLCAPDFRQVLKQFAINLTEEEFFQILNYYDGQLHNRVPYNAFLRTFLV
ncbi:EF-hand calcium-binding domain-containing protein 6 [Lethenteron reissneri]|uniref:EF-hand calcium-binding domain-containing protein 6 n=1 Tax=Lethenteron reissneri TaxID=7753 RepID=UPI002AB6ADAB|nr:EF-hand calcium-binding domain-containing protein 6 [Lethenteron reissneri]